MKFNPRTRTQEGHESNPRNREPKDTNRPATSGPADSDFDSNTHLCMISLT